MRYSFLWLWGILLPFTALTQPYTIDQGGATSCTGILYDSGGPTGDYQNNEYHIFSICPDEPQACILFELSYYDIEYNQLAITDQLLFYDGNDIANAPLIGVLGGSNLTLGSNGGGGVCFQVQAASGCMTVQFVSDGTSTFSGFAGQWSCSTTPCQNAAPLALTFAPSSTDIAASLSSPSAVLNLANVNCSDAALATFNSGDQTELGLGSGVLLTSGEATYAPGPNNSEGFANFFSGNLGRPGDRNLDSLSRLVGSTETTADACVLELLVTPNSNTLEFEYVFASEEYPEFVLNDYNDIFAFLVAGPGIDGPTALDNQINIAALSDGTVVEINSINNQVNWEYYRNNRLGQGLQYDGLTSDSLGRKKTLTARTPVTPCETYRLKLAIADRGDGSFDSGVFVGKIEGGSPEIAANYGSGLAAFSESCQSEADEFIITFFNGGSSTLSFQLTIGGTAERGLDYTTTLPDQLDFPPGQSVFSFPITVLRDPLMNEGEETIRLQLRHDYGCGQLLLSEAIFTIQDQVNLQINVPSDTVRLCGNTDLSLNASGADNYQWSPAANVSTPFSATTNINVANSQWIYVASQLSANCMVSDSVFIGIQSEANIEIAAESISICTGDTITLQSSSASMPLGTISWTPTSSTLGSTQDSLLVVAPTATTIYTATITTASCTASDSIVVVVIPFDPPVLIADTTLCANETSQLLLAGPIDWQYTWRILGDPTFMASGADLLVRGDGFPDLLTYVLQASNGPCQFSDSVRISRLPTISLSLGEEQTVAPPDETVVMLNATLSETVPNGNFEWVFDGQTISNQLNYEFEPSTTTLPNYAIAHYTDACQTLEDSIFIALFDVQMPNFFSPNGDGVNDVFKPYSLQVFDEVDIKIFNRWGQLVFRSSSPSDNTWTGLVNGKAAPADVYLYQVQLRLGERSRTLSGQVTLAR